MLFCMFALNYKYHFLPGVYIPLTVEGNIIVDGVLASCHASADHGVAHFFTTPIQLFPWITEWIYGEDNGCQVFATVLENLGQLVLPNDLLYYKK